MTPNSPIIRDLIESAHSDVSLASAQRYRELLDHCAEIEQDREAAVQRARFFVAKYQFWQRRWRLTVAALCAVVACWVICEVGRWM